MFGLRDARPDEGATLVLKQVEEQIPHRHLGAVVVTATDDFSSEQPHWVAVALMNLQGGYRFNKHWKIRMDVFNLFNRIDHDTDYAYESRIKDNVGVLQDTTEEIHFHPVEKRSARLTLTATFQPRNAQAARGRAELGRKFFR